MHKKQRTIKAHYWCELMSIFENPTYINGIDWTEASYIHNSPINLGPFCLLYYDISLHDWSNPKYNNNNKKNTLKAKFLSTIKNDPYYVVLA